jgi:hypothetical protein
MNETPGSVFVRRYITGLWLTVIGLIVGIGVSTLLWFGRRTSMFRDAGIPQQSLSEWVFRRIVTADSGLS